MHSDTFVIGLSAQAARTTTDQRHDGDDKCVKRRLHPQLSPVRPGWVCGMFVCWSN